MTWQFRSREPAGVYPELVEGLYLLRHFVPQKDAAALRATRLGFIILFCLKITEKLIEPAIIIIAIREIQQLC